MTDASSSMDFTVTRLNTLQYLIEICLAELTAFIEDAASLDDKVRIQIASRLQHITNLVDMSSEISESLEPALRDVARAVQGFADAGEIDRACVNSIFENYTRHLGDRAADQLFADALGK